MLGRSKFFSRFVEEIEKLELSLSKQHNKMLKIVFEMLKIIKNVKMIKLEKIFPGISRIPEIPRIFGSHKSRGFSGSRELPGIPEKFLRNFLFPGELKIRVKGNLIAIHRWVVKSY